VLAVGALIAGFGLLVAKTGSVKNAFATMGNFVIGIFERMANVYVDMINTIISGLNVINPFSDIPEIAAIKLPRFAVDKKGNPVTAPTVNTGPDYLERQFGRVPALPAPVGLPAPSGGAGGAGGLPAATGGIIDTLRDLPSLGGGGGGGTGAVMGNEAVLDGLTGGITVIVNAAVAEASLGDKIVEALTDYNRRSGPINLAIA